MVRLVGCGSLQRKSSLAKRLITSFGWMLAPRICGAKHMRNIVTGTHTQEWLSHVVTMLTHMPFTRDFELYNTCDCHPKLQYSTVT